MRGFQPLVLAVCLAGMGAFSMMRGSALALPDRAMAPHRPAVLVSITISPSLADMDLDATQTFTATGKDELGNDVTGLSVTWTVSPTAGAIVSTGPTTMTFRSGTMPGDFPKAIQAVSGSVVGTANVLLRPGPPASIVISPSVVTLDINTTQTFTASVFDRFGNPRADLGVTWLTPPPVAGTIETSTANSAVFRAGTVAGTFSAGLQASNPPALQSVTITVRPGPPTLVQASALPTTLRTDGRSSTNIVALVTDQYGNQVGQGVPVAFALESCPGTCALNPDSGVTNDQSRASTVLRSTYTSPTQTLTATIVVRASINAGAASDAATVTGVFTPHRSLMPAVTKVWLPANHTACSAFRVTLPASVSQPANNAFNIYRFTAQTGSYTALLSNYTTSGQLLLYLIENDACATSGIMSVNFIASTPITGPSFQTTFANTFIPGRDYLLAVYTTGALTNTFYTITIRP